MATSLFSPITIGKLTLKNRIAMTPLTRARAGITRMPNKYIAEHYAMRSGCGLIIAEAAAVSPQGYGWYAAPAIYTKEMAEGWKQVTKAVHDNNGKIFIQLWHMGRQSHSSFHATNEIVAPSAIKVPGDAHTRSAKAEQVPYEVPRALKTEELPLIVNDYKEAAKLAILAGFDGVEVHSANGYLLDTFLQSSTNKRTDKYGGSFENRARLLMEILEAIKTVLPANQIGVRVSPNGQFGGMGSEDNCEMFPAVAKMLKGQGLAYLHVMDGLGFGYHGKCRVVTLHEMKTAFEGNIMANVSITKENAEGMLRSGACDLIGIGRPFMSNPDLAERWQNNWPLEPEAPLKYWWAGTADPKDCLEGYLTYKPYKK